MGFESDTDVNLKKNRDSERYLGTHQFSSECRKKLIKKQSTTSVVDQSENMTVYQNRI